MGNCLVTKLKDSIGDESIYKLGESRIEITEVEDGGGFFFSCDGLVKVLKGKVALGTPTGEQYTPSSEPFSIPNPRNMYILENGTILSILNKYGMKFFEEATNASDKVCLKILDEKIFDYWLFPTDTTYGGVRLMHIDLDNKPWGYSTIKGIGTSRRNPVRLMNFSFENFDLEHLPNLTILSIAPHKYISPNIQDISNFASHVGLTHLYLRDARYMFGGEVSNLARAWIKNGRTSGVIYLMCNVNMTINGRACAYQEEVWIHLDSSLPNGYELTSTEPILPL